LYAVISFVTVFFKADQNSVSLKINKLLCFYLI